MNTNETNFRAWFIVALQPLRDKGDAGFIFALTALPLLERYLREKSGAGESKSLPPQFFSELEVMFPDIQGKQNDFWHSYRNGLLHQVSFSKTKVRDSGVVVVMPKAGLSGYDPRPVYYDTGSNSFYMNPMVFFDTVTAKILSDFSTYEGTSSPSHNLPSIVVPGFFGFPNLVPTIAVTGNYTPPPPPTPPAPSSGP